MAWNHTAQIICTIANVHRDHDKQKEPFTTEQFHPYHAAKHTPVRSGVPITAASIKAKVDAELAKRGGRLTP